MSEQHTETKISILPIPASFTLVSIFDTKPFNFDAIPFSTRNPFVNRAFSRFIHRKFLKSTLLTRNSF